MNWRISTNDYTIQGALLWGNCLKHARLAYGAPCQEKFIHLTIAALEALPIISQVVSLIEYVVQSRFPLKAPELPAPAINLVPHKPPPIPTEDEVEKEQQILLRSKRPSDLIFDRQGLNPLSIEIQDRLFIAQQMTGAKDVIQEIYQPLLSEVEESFTEEFKSNRRINLCKLKTIPNALSTDKILTQFECGLSLGLARYPVKDPTAAVSSKTFYENKEFKQLIEGTGKSPSTAKPVKEKETYVCAKALSIVTDQLRFHSTVINSLLENGYIQKTKTAPKSMLERIKLVFGNFFQKTSFETPFDH